VDGIVCLSDLTKCLGVDTLLVGDTGLFSTVDGPASLWNCFHGPVSCSPCLRAYIAPYFPPVGSYGFHSLGGGGGGGSLGGGSFSIGLSRSSSGSGFHSLDRGRGGGSLGGGSSSMGLSRSSLGSGSSVMAGVGSMYSFIEKCSRLCPWLQRRGERARCNGEGGLGGSGRGRGRGSDCRGGNGDWVGNKGCTTSGA